jgi:hypothetical protein
MDDLARGLLAALKACELAGCGAYDLGPGFARDLIDRLDLERADVLRGRGWPATPMYLGRHFFPADLKGTERFLVIPLKEAPRE